MCMKRSIMNMMRLGLPANDRALAADDRQMTPETTGVLNYRSAVWTGYRLVQDTGLLTSHTMVALQEELEGNSAGIRSLPGTARRSAGYARGGTGVGGCVLLIVLLTEVGEVLRRIRH